MPASRTHSRGLMWIAVFKLLKGAALLALGIGALKLLHKDVSAIAEHWINAFRADPHNRYLHWLLAKLPMVDDRKLKEFSVGTFIYSAVFLTEGTGLALSARWAEYLTIITTGSFLPVEIYEVVRRATMPRGAALVINIVIVLYLIRELRRYPGRTHTGR